MRRTLAALCACAHLFAAAAAADEPSALARAFGAAPYFGAELSPDGSDIAFLRADPDGSTYVEVVRIADQMSRTVLESDKRTQDLRWCRWANVRRLVCGAEPLLQVRGPASIASLIGIDVDGADPKVLYRNTGGAGRRYDRVIDWLPDDPDHVLIETAVGRDMSVLRLNVYTGEREPLEAPTKTASGEQQFERSTTAALWISDNHGAMRARVSLKEGEWELFVRDTPQAEWQFLRSEDARLPTERWSALGFGDNRDELLYLARSGERVALFGLDLAHGRAQRLIFRHDHADIAAVLALGKHHRAVAALYRDNRVRLHVFDARVARAIEGAQRLLPGREILPISESWDERYYLLLVRDDTSPGTYYRYDAGAEDDAHALREIAPLYPSLEGQPLAPVRAVRFEDANGVEVFGYLSVPTGVDGPAPAVVLTTGGPDPFERGYWFYDYLAQYLTARGYAVLQLHEATEPWEWMDKGGFRTWPKTVGAVVAATDTLVADGIADPERICVAGVHYGGYTAFLSAIEHPDRYACVVSIGGIANPETAIASFDEAVLERLIGDDDLVREKGSPSKRADEIEAPVLIVHAGFDDEASIVQAQDFTKRLKRRDKDVTYVAYERATSDFRPRSDRIDMLDRVGDFLGRVLEAKP